MRMIFDMRTWRKRSRKGINRHNKPSTDYSNLLLRAPQAPWFLESGSGYLNVNIGIVTCVFLSKTCNPFFAFSVAVKKARFVCEDGSYMGRIGKITMEDESFHSPDPLICCPQLFFSYYRTYTSEILTRVGNRAFKSGSETSRRTEVFIHASLLKSADNLLHFAIGIAPSFGLCDCSSRISWRSDYTEIIFPRGDITYLPVEDRRMYRILINSSRYSLYTWKLSKTFLNGGEKIKSIILIASENLESMSSFIASFNISYGDERNLTVFARALILCPFLNIHSHITFTSS